MGKGLNLRICFSTISRVSQFPACLKACNASSELISTPLFSYVVPNPVAFFPLNGIFGTREIQDRAPEGIQGEVHLAPGPNGHENGSFEFSGTSNSYIEFPNSAGGVLDARYSITLLLWVSYNGQDGPLIQYNTGAGGQWGLYLWSFVQGGLTGHFIRRNYQILQHIHLSNALTSGEWKFVGYTYDYSSGEQKLWVDGVVVQASNVGSGNEMATQDSVRMGARINDGGPLEAGSPKWEYTM